jgi:hypothetical protein
MREATFILRGMRKPLILRHPGPRAGVQPANVCEPKRTLSRGVNESPHAKDFA